MWLLHNCHKDLLPSCNKKIVKDKLMKINTVLYLIHLNYYNTEL